MRFRDFLLTVLVSVLATVLTVQLLITIEYIPTQRTQQTQIRQTITGQFTTPATGYPQIHHILNATQNAAARVLHIHIEFNVIFNPNRSKIDFSLWLMDDSLNNKKIAEVKDSDSAFGVLSLDISVSVNHAYSVWIWITSPYISNGTYQGTIIQDLSF